MPVPNRSAASCFAHDNIHVVTSIHVDALSGLATGQSIHPPAIVTVTSREEGLRAHCRPRFAPLFVAGYADAETWAAGMRARAARLETVGHLHLAVCHLLAVGDVWPAVQTYM